MIPDVFSRIFADKKQAASACFFLIFQRPEPDPCVIPGSGRIYLYPSRIFPGTGIQGPYPGSVPQAMPCPLPPAFGFLAHASQKGRPVRHVHCRAGLPVWPDSTHPSGAPYLLEAVNDGQHITRQASSALRDHAFRNLVVRLGDGSRDAGQGITVPA